MRTFRRFVYVATAGMIDLRSDQELIDDYHRRLVRAQITPPLGRELEGTGATGKAPPHE